MLITFYLLYIIKSKIHEVNVIENNYNNFNGRIIRQTKMVKGRNCTMNPFMDKNFPLKKTKKHNFTISHFIP